MASLIIQTAADDTTGAELIVHYNEIVLPRGTSTCPQAPWPPVPQKTVTVECWEFRHSFPKHRIKHRPNNSLTKPKCDRKTEEWTVPHALTLDTSLLAFNRGKAGTIPLPSPCTCLLELHRRRFVAQAINDVTTMEWPPF